MSRPAKQDAARTRYVFEARTDHIADRGSSRTGLCRPSRMFLARVHGERHIGKKRGVARGPPCAADGGQPSTGSSLTTLADLEAGGPGAWQYMVGAGRRPRRGPAWRRSTAVFGAVARPWAPIGRPPMPAQRNRWLGAGFPGQPRRLVRTRHLSVARSAPRRREPASGRRAWQVFRAGRPGMLRQPLGKASWLSRGFLSRASSAGVYG